MSSQDPSMIDTKTRLKGSEILWATLEGEGVRELFGYPGGAILPAYDALRKFPIRHILVRHEQSAVHMADGYARASGRVGVAIATSGPGATNMVTGIATAMLDSIPVVCITGQVGSKVLGTDAFQEVDITGVTLPLTKHNYVVTRAEDLAAVLRDAFRVARSGRPGPVLVDITKDAQQATAEFDFAAAVPEKLGKHPMLHVSQDGIVEAAEFIRSAQRPLILAGHGIIQSGAMSQVRALAERAQIPVACTLLGLGGFPASHELNLGMMGMHGESWVNHSIQEADLLIACGMRFDDRVTVLTRDLCAESAQDPYRYRSFGDQQERRCASFVDRRFGPGSGPALAAHSPARRRPVAGYHRPHEGRCGGARHQEPARRWSSLRRACDPRSVACNQGRCPDRHRRRPAPDVGGAVLTTAMRSRGSLITSGGLGTMGFALPAAIGAKVACPDKEVWVIAGDGGFQMTSPELATDCPGTTRY